MNWKQNLLTLALCSSLALGCQANDENRLDAIFSATPEQSDSFVHFRVPVVYSPWEKRVVELFGPYSLAKYQSQLDEDLPPSRGYEKPDPRNLALDENVETGEAEKVLRNLLAGDLSKPQWCAIQLIEERQLSGYDSLLVKISQQDPSETDRAFALRALSKRLPDHHDVFQESLWDRSYSVRLLSGMLLKDEDSGLENSILLHPARPRNPFHYLFLQEVLANSLPDSNPGEFFSRKPKERLEAIQAKYSSFGPKLMKALRSRPDNLVTSNLLLVLGEENEIEAAWSTIENELLAQGSRKEAYHSPDFWFQSEVIQTLWYAPESLKAILIERLRVNVDEFETRREALLLVLAYACQNLELKQAEPYLAKIRSLSSTRYDLYQAAASGLAGMKSQEAFPSLIHVLSFKKKPFTQVSLGHLEELTGIETPGKPEDLGVLHNIGLPKEEIDRDQVYEFWKKWYAENKDRLTFSSQDNRFVPQGR